MQRAKAPTYLSSFKCIQHRCTDHCCYGWRVTLDLKTFEKYQSTAIPVNGLKMPENIDLTPEPARTEINYGYIKMKPENRLCAFFTQEGLCAVHRDLGVSYLSKTCTTYPRCVRRIFGRYSTDLTLSCPEAARLALLSLTPATFEEISVPDEAFQYAPDDTPSGASAAGLFYESLQMNIIRLLQRRSLTISERMIVLGMMVQNLEGLLAEDRAIDIPALLSKFGNRLNDADIKRQTDALTVDPALPCVVSLELVAISRMEGFSLPGFHRLVEMSGRAFGVEKDRSIEEVAGQYRTIRERFGKTIDEDLAFVLENFLVHRALHVSMPFGPDRAPFATYMQTVILLTIVRQLAYGRAAEEGNLIPEKLAEIIQLVTKTIEHSPACLRSIDTLFKDNGLFNLAHAAALLLA